MPEDGENLEQWGDVIKIDSPHAPRKTNWKISPIAIMYAGRHFRAIGIVFTAFRNE
jgi:hypothetical protein